MYYSVITAEANELSESPGGSSLLEFIGTVYQQEAKQHLTRYFGLEKLWSELGEKKVNTHIYLCAHAHTYIYIVHVCTDIIHIHVYIYWWTYILDKYARILYTLGRWASTHIYIGVMVNALL